MEYIVFMYIVHAHAYSISAMYNFIIKRIVLCKILIQCNWPIRDKNILINK